MDINGKIGTISITQNCPFCKSQLLNLNTPEGCDSFILIGANSKTKSINVDRGNLVNVKMCPSCRAMFMFDPHK